MDNFTIKEKWQYSTATFTLFSGIVLCFLSFFLHSHTIHDSILMYFGQTLIFCASVFGINLFIKNKVLEAESRINDKIDKKMQKVDNIIKDEE